LCSILSSWISNRTPAERSSSKKKGRVTILSSFMDALGERGSSCYDLPWEKGIGDRRAGKGQKDLASQVHLIAF
jgi:hypothetical protein